MSGKVWGLHRFSLGGQKWEGYTEGTALSGAALDNVRFLLQPCSSLYLVEPIQKNKEPHYLCSSSHV